jgi:arginine-tRNA-protein transferase
MRAHLRPLRSRREQVREARGRRDPCPYLAGRDATMRYRFVENCSVETYLAMLERGWRRFGGVFFRPVCADCHECRSLRVVVDEFRPDRSLRRNWARNRDLRAVLQPPTVSGAHLDLYERYHADMAVRRGWAEKSETPLDYYMTFVEAHREFGHELLLYDGDDLVTVALVDVLPDALSAVYCYYEPELRRRGLGVHAILRQLDHARRAGLRHLYLGYWIAGNRSMAYKARYGPHEILAGRPELAEDPRWLATTPSGRPAAPRANPATSAEGLGARPV